MAGQLDELIEAVKRVSSDNDVAAIARMYSLKPEDRAGVLDQVLGDYRGVLDGKPVQIIHRWYDRSKPFSIQPDGNKVELRVDGVQVATGSFLDDH